MSRFAVDLSEDDVMRLNHALKLMREELQRTVPHIPIPNIEFSLKKMVGICIKKTIDFEDYAKVA